MRVINISKNTILSEDVFVADTFARKAKGLISFSSPRSLFLETRWGIHTFGMKFPIDCLVCDRDFTVRALRENLTAGNFFFWRPLYKKVLELPAGTIERTKTQIGDTLQFN